MTSSSSGAQGHHHHGTQETPGQVAASVRLHQTQRQVDEVIGIMRSNVDKVLERDHKLTELDKITAALEEGASDFEVETKKVKKNYEGRGRGKLYCCKVMMCVLGILLLLILFILCDLFLTRWVFWVKCSETVGGLGLWCKVVDDNATTTNTSTTALPPPETVEEEEETVTSPPPPSKKAEGEEPPPPPPLHEGRASPESNLALVNKGHNVLDTGVLVEGGGEEEKEQK